MKNKIQVMAILALISGFFGGFLLDEYLFEEEDRRVTPFT